MDTQYRRTVDTYFKQVCNGEIDGLTKFQNHKIIPSKMDRGTIYDYVYFPAENKWQSWMDLTNKDEIDKFPAES